MSDLKTGRRPDKREAILSGALSRFVHDGYTRASIDAIAAEAGVSTRTIYNHFGDKAHLFEAVIRDSAEKVAERQVAVIDRHLRKIVDLEDDLIEFGIDWSAEKRRELGAHWALVRQINAEIEHIPKDALEAWLEAGPMRVRRALAEHLSALPARAGVTFDDPLMAALHLMLLIQPDNLDDADTASPEEVEAMVRAGIRVFLRGYTG